jgi:hypothetical protein
MLSVRCFDLSMNWRMLVDFTVNICILYVVCCLLSIVCCLLLDVCCLLYGVWCMIRDCVLHTVVVHVIHET